MNKATLPQIENLREVGQELLFEYHCFESHQSQDAQLWYRSHQLVTITGLAPNDGLNIASLEERNECGCPIMYNIKFEDGFVGEAFEDELVDSKKEFWCDEPPVMN